jgi:hypothetical protein
MRMGWLKRADARDFTSESVPISRCNGGLWAVQHVQTFCLLNLKSERLRSGCRGCPIRRIKVTPAGIGGEVVAIESSAFVGIKPLSKDRGFSKNANITIVFSDIYQVNHQKDRTRECEAGGSPAAPPIHINDSQPKHECNKIRI